MSKASAEKILSEAREIAAECYKSSESDTIVENLLFGEFKYDGKDYTDRIPANATSADFVEAERIFTNSLGE